MSELEIFVPDVLKVADPEGYEPPISPCFGCKHFEQERWESWEYGTVEYEFFCHAVRKNGEPLYKDNIMEELREGRCNKRESEK